MRTLIGRRDVLTFGALATASSVLGPRGFVFVATRVLIYAEHTRRGGGAVPTLKWRSVPAFGPRSRSA
jgi:hypothetical protein